MPNNLPLANVIFGLNVAFYITTYFFFIIVVPLEAYIFKRLENITFSRILTYIFFANIVSWILGIIISAPLMNFLEIYAFSSDPDRDGVMEFFFAFIIAFFISWLIEYVFIICFKKRLSLSKPFKTAFYANMFSYLLIYIVHFGGIIIDGFIG